MTLVIAVLIAWKLTTGKIAADHIATGKDEVFYWLTILVSNTLGTALGGLLLRNHPRPDEQDRPTFYDFGARERMGRLGVRAGGGGVSPA